MEATILSESDRLIILGLIVSGLTTDGAHHKQYFLEEIAKYLKFDGHIKMVHYTEGVAP